MERLITVSDVMERYGCSRQTARRYIRQCVPHMEKPLAATETAFCEWEDGRTVVPVFLSRKESKGIFKRRDEERVYIPRRR